MSESADEKLIQQLEEELKKVKVSDLLVQTLYTVSSLGLQPARRARTATSSRRSSRSRRCGR